MALTFATMLNAQVNKVGNVYSAPTKTEQTSQKTEFQYKDTDGKTYPIYLSKNGRAYIIRTSQKSGNEYRKYLGEEISRDICKQLGVQYVEKK